MIKHDQAVPIVELNIERSKFQFVQFSVYFSLSLSFFTIIIIHEEARYTPSMKLVRGSTKGPEAVTRFDNQRYIFNGMFYRSRRNLRSWYAYSSTLSIARNAGKRIFERITCRGGRGERRWPSRVWIQTFGIPVSTANNAAAIPCNLRRFRTSQSKLNVIRTKLTFRPRINEGAQ